MTICACGCGGAITPKRWHKYNGTRYIDGHQSRDRQVVPEERDCGYETPCLIWTGSLNHAGYGKGGGHVAHKIAWERVHGPVPGDMTLDHLCRIRACVNPAHLELVTHQENVRRGAVARQRGTGTPLRSLRHAARLSQRDLAELLGVSQASVSHWEQGHYPPPEGVLARVREIA